jgi:tetratricopeptide (TPR) repeat protein
LITFIVRNPFKLQRYKEVANMKLSSRKLSSSRLFSRQIVRSALSAGAAGLLLLTLSGCGADLLTWAKDAKRQGAQQYNDGRYAEAAGSFRNAIRQDPTDFETEYWLALSCEQTGSFPQAIDAYKTCLKLMPAPGTVRWSQAIHEDAFDRLAQVVAKYDRTGSEADLIAQEASRDLSTEDYRLLGRVLRYRGDADSALDNYRRAVQINPNNFAAQRELGLYLERLSQNQEAGTVLRDAYRLNSSDDQINQALQRIGITPGPDLLAVAAPARPVLVPRPIPADQDMMAPASNSMGPARQIPVPRD